jgi:hypothetical protein
VLSDWSYTKKDKEEAEVKGHRERQRLMLARKRLRCLLAWVFDRYELIDYKNHPINPMTEFYYPYLAQLGRTIVSYKTKAMRAGIHHRDRDCSVQDVKDIVENTMRSPAELWTLYQNPKIPNNSMAWKGTQFVVRKIANPVIRAYKLAILLQ